MTGATPETITVPGRDGRLRPGLRRRRLGHARASAARTTGYLDSHEPAQAEATAAPDARRCRKQRAVSGGPRGGSDADTGRGVGPRLRARMRPDADGSHARTAGTSRPAPSQLGGRRHPRPTRRRLWLHRLLARRSRGRTGPGGPAGTRRAEETARPPGRSADRGRRRAGRGPGSRSRAAGGGTGPGGRPWACCSASSAPFIVLGAVAMVIALRADAGPHRGDGRHRLRAVRGLLQQRHPHRPVRHHEPADADRTTSSSNRKHHQRGAGRRGPELLQRGRHLAHRHQCGPPSTDLTGSDGSLQGGSTITQEFVRQYYAGHRHPADGQPQDQGDLRGHEGGQGEVQAVDPAELPQHDLPG